MSYALHHLTRPEGTTMNLSFKPCRIRRVSTISYQFILIIDNLVYQIKLYKILKIDIYIEEKRGSKECLQKHLKALKMKSFCMMSHIRHGLAMSNSTWH